MARTSTTTVLFIAAVLLFVAAGSAHGQACPGIPTLNYWNLIKTPPSPNITIEYDQASNLFDFAVDATYLRENSVYVIDFARFDNEDAARDIYTPNTCENRVASDFKGVAFSDMWGAAGDALQESAIGTTEYLAYPPSNIWSATPLACDTVRYETSLTFGGMLGCEDHNGVQAISKTLVSLSPVVYKYEGTLFASVVQPINSADENLGYRNYEFKTAFEWTTTFASNAIASIESEQDLIINVLNLQLTEDGNLQVVIETTTPLDPYGLVNPAVPVGPPGYTLTFVSETGTPSKSSTQVWVLESTKPVDNYNGDYEFSFDLASSGEPVLALINLQMEVSEVVSEEIAVDMELFVYTDPYVTEYEYQVSEPFGSGDSVWVKSRPAVNEEDYNSFSNKIVNVWLCFTQSGSAAVWDPENGQYGCSAITADIPFDNQVHMIAAGVEQLEGRNGLMAAFQTAIDPAELFVYSSEAGFHFRAVPLAFQDDDYYIHVESLILPLDVGSRKRGLISHTIYSSSAGNSAEFYMEYARNVNDVAETGESASAALGSDAISAKASAFQLAGALNNGDDNDNDDNDDGDNDTTGGRSTNDTPKAPDDDGLVPTIAVVGVLTNMCCFVVVFALIKRRRDNEEEEKKNNEQLPASPSREALMV